LERIHSKTVCFAFRQVKLKDSLMSSVVFSQAKDAELAWVDGQIHFSSATSKGVVGVDGDRNNAEDRKTDLVPVLDGLPQNQVHDDLMYWKGKATPWEVYGWQPYVTR